MTPRSTWPEPLPKADQLPSTLEPYIAHSSHRSTDGNEAPRTLTRSDLEHNLQLTAQYHSRQYSRPNSTTASTPPFNSLAQGDNRYDFSGPGHWPPMNRHYVDQGPHRDNQMVPTDYRDARRFNPMYSNNHRSAIALRANYRPYCRSSEIRLDCAVSVLILSVGATNMVFLV
jgi:hypothetical protein